MISGAIKVPFLCREMKYTVDIIDVGSKNIVPYNYIQGSEEADESMGKDNKRNALKLLGHCRSVE